METKTYIGKGKVIGQYGTVRLNLELTKIDKSLIFESKSGKKFLNIYVNGLREKDQDGNTLSVYTLPKQQTRPQVDVNNVEKEVF
jgi:hypothetical protein